MKKISATFLLAVTFVLVQTSVLFGQGTTATNSTSVFWDFNSPLVYLLLLAASLTVLTIYTVIQVKSTLTELGYVDNGSTNPTLRWTANNQTTVAVIIILIVLAGIFLAI
ncbi:MAG: hypothetical protein POELPBGB_01188 [Bacteroidia bacterium]|nr:hypothetical protein [Bacteroidia bacterium]